MATMRNLLAISQMKTLLRLSCPVRCVLPLQQTLRQCSNQVVYATDYTESRKRVKYLRELYNRRLKVGPEPERHPSVYGCWNHETELYAFGQRYGEEFDQEILRTAFRQKTFVEADISKQEELGIEIEEVLDDNTELAERGHALASRYIKAYLRASYPQLFEEVICAIHDHLMSDETIYHIASNFGLRDLIQSNEYPPLEEDYNTTFMAVIGALAESSGDEKAERFVLDFIIPQLIGKDIGELWQMKNPMGLLKAVLKAQKRGLPESRLLWSSAQNTVMSVHHVGIYSDKVLLGRSPGETVFIAEELAARESLKIMFKLTDSQSPLMFGEKANNLKLTYDKENPSAERLMSKS